MPDSGFVAVFLVGLLGGVHCVGMCGGIVAALSAPGAAGRLPGLLAYNLGRVTTYAALGGVFGAIGSASLLFNQTLPVQLAFYVLANCLLVLLGLYLMGVTRALGPLERLGQRIWRRVQPLGKRFLPVRNWQQALPLGMVWGLIPCGLIYSVLSTALVSGSAARGAMLMACFGLGTLPNLLLAGVLLARFRAFSQQAALRLGAGLLVAGFGVLGLIRAPELGGRLWQGIICAV